MKSMSAAESLTELDVPQSLLDLIQGDLDRMDRCTDYPPYAYPWNDLLDRQQSLRIVGYGSLVNLDSARKTLYSSDLQNSRPVIAFGARRLYNYIMSPKSLGRFNTPANSSHRGVLNTIVTGQARDYFNGLEIELHPDDFERFREREFAYDLLPIVTLPWQNWQVRPGVAYVLSCRCEWMGERQMLSSSIDPHPGYQALCEQGYRDISDSFLHWFRRTTRSAHEDFRADH